MVQYNDSRPESAIGKLSNEKTIKLMMKNLLLAILAAGLMAGCSSEPSKPATAEKPQPKAPPQAITGSTAFFKCYISARGWAPDQIFNVQFLKADTDKAFAVAQQHGGDKLLQKEPDTPVFYVLEWNRQANELLWHVIYGTDRETAKLRVAVNASTGEFSRVEK